MIMKRVLQTLPLRRAEAVNGQGITTDHQFLHTSLLCHTPTPALKKHSTLLCRPGDALSHFNVPGKVVQDGLPSLPLLLHRVFGFSIKSDAHRDAICTRLELDLHLRVLRRNIQSTCWAQIWICIGAPDFTDGRFDDGFNSNFHGV